MFDWFWAYLTYRSGTRLITGGVESSPRQNPPDLKFVEPLSSRAQAV